MKKLHLILDRQEEQALTEFLVEQVFGFEGDFDLGFDNQEQQPIHPTQGKYGTLIDALMVDTMTFLDNVQENIYHKSEEKIVYTQSRFLWLIKEFMEGRQPYALPIDYGLWERMADPKWYKYYCDKYFPGQNLPPNLESLEIFPMTLALEVPREKLFISHATLSHLILNRLNQCVRSGTLSPNLKALYEKVFSPEYLLDIIIGTSFTQKDAEQAVTDQLIEIMANDAQHILRYGLPIDMETGNVHLRPYALPQTKGFPEIIFNYPADRFAILHLRYNGIGLSTHLTVGKLSDVCAEHINYRLKDIVLGLLSEKSDIAFFDVVMSKLGWCASVLSSEEDRGSFLDYASLMDMLDIPSTNPDDGSSYGIPLLQELIAFMYRRHMFTSDNLLSPSSVHSFIGYTMCNRWFSVDAFHYITIEYLKKSKHSSSYHVSSDVNLLFLLDKHAMWIERVIYLDENYKYQLIENIYEEAYNFINAYFSVPQYLLDKLES
jgi:hypothetical protein